MNVKNLTTILCATLLFACTNTDPNQVTIKGDITNPKGEFVTFSNQDTSYSTTVNEDGTFAISFILDSATYLNFELGVEHTAMFVKPGDKIKLSIDTEEFDETIEYKGSLSSSFLAKKYLLKEGNDFFGKVFYMSSGEVYKAVLDSFKIAVINEFGDITDSTFINSEITGIDKDIKYFIGRQKKLAEYSDDVKTYLWETRAINRDFNFYTALDSLNVTDFKLMTEQFTEASQSSLNKVNDLEYRVTVNEQIAESNKKWLERKTSVDNMPKEGESIIDFSYPYKDGNEFSLASFKGNLVYVDVWATWCGPCKAEIPSLQKLEADYHGKDIIFMSVSVDTDKEAWEKMVAEKELGGVQLWADGWSKITKDYAIFGIPRFMLFDANGNVISTDAPRPSSEDIRELLDVNL